MSAELGEWVGLGAVDESWTKLPGEGGLKGELCEWMTFAGGEVNEEAKLQKKETALLASK